jgi:predicted HicB family RNase H-like nuclease
LTHQVFFKSSANNYLPKLSSRSKEYHNTYYLIHNPPNCDREDVKASKKATVNLFIDENVIGELKKEADYHGISLNAKVSSILTKHVNFYRHAEALEAVT